MIMRLKKNNNRNQPGVLKNILESGAVSTNQLNPLFSFQYLDSNYNVSNCEKHDKAELSNQLQVLGSKKWQDLQQAPKHGLGCEKIERNSIQKTIPPHLKDDAAVNFLSFRFSGKKPMVGYRVDQTFHVIWIDRDFTVYNHN